MKLFIYYAFVPNEEIGKIIRNNTNNENWPIANTYIKIIQEWNGEILKQQEIVKRYVEHLKARKKGDDAFLIALSNELGRMIGVLNRKDKDGNYLLDRTPELKAELLSLQEGKKIVVQEKALIDDPLWKSSFIKLMPNADIREWNNNRQKPIPKINEILDAWEADKDKHDKEFDEIDEVKSFQIHLKERTQDTITFIWTLPKLEVDIEGKKSKIRVFPNIKNYIFHFNGQYYEVLDWEQTNYDTAEIIAEISIFYNYYWYLIKSSANGIFHHSSMITAGSEEICSCPEYNIATMGSIWYSVGSENSPPAIGSLSIHKVDVEQEATGDGEGF